MPRRGRSRGGGGERVAVDHSAAAGDELEIRGRVVGIHEHRAKIAGVMHSAAGQRRIAKAGVDVFRAAQAIDEIGNVADVQALEVVLVAVEHGIRPPLLEGPLHVHG